MDPQPGAGQGEGRYGSVTEMAAEEKIERGYLGSLLRLTLLARDIVQRILDGRQLNGVTLPRLLEPFPPNWAQQLRAVADPCESTGLA